jgi:hypothetical protein
MSERVVTLSDGTRYVFPEGTPERVINRAMIRQRNRQQREQRYQDRQQARETADQYRAGRERIMGSELPADDTGAIRDVRQYIGIEQLKDDIGEGRASMRAEQIAGPRDIGRERFISAVQGRTLGAAPYLQGGVTGIAGALGYPLLDEDAREGRSYPEFISEMTSRGYQRARTDIDRAREDRPLETLAIEAAGGLLAGKTVYDEHASRYLPNRPGVAGAAVGAGTGAQYGFLDTEGDPEMTALAAGLGGPFGAGVAKALQATAGPVGRMFRGEPAQAPEPEPELPAGEYLRRRSMRAGSPVMGERTQQLRADWEPVTADLTGASTTAQSAARATEAATQARTPDALSAALAAKRALRTKIEGIVEARAGASTPEDQRLADALAALSQDTRDPVQLGTQVSVARNNLDRVLADLGQGREGNLIPVPTRPPVRRTFSPEEEARTIPDETGRPSRTRYAEGEEAQWNTNQTFFIGSPNKNIENFEIRTTTGRIGQGVYATPQRQLAEGYTKSAGTYLPNKRGGKVYEVYIRGKLASEEEFYEALRGAQAASDMNQRKFSSIDELEKANQKIERDAQRILKERGFTGFLRRHDADGQNFEADEVIVFDPANVRRVDDPRFKKKAETPDDTQMGLSGNATLTNAFAGGAIGAVAPAESAEERARNVALGVGLGAGASRLGLRAGGARGMGVGADDVPRPVQQARKSGYEGSDTGESHEWLAAIRKGLRMDTPSRMARAREQGFDTETVLYHGTDAEFDEFSLTGKRFPALGIGHYFSPNPNKASGYGSQILPVYLKTNKLLDWSKLSPDQRLEIANALAEKAPKEVLAGFGNIKEEILPSDPKQARARFEEIKKATANNYHDRAKPVMDQNDAGQVVVRYTQPGLESAKPTDLLNLAQMYDREIAKRLGYDAAKYGDEIVVFDSKNIRSVHAAFDPDNAGSSTLLAAAPFAVGGAALGAGATDD